MSRRCWLGIDDPEPWVSRDVDRECLEMAYVLLAVISPVTAPGRDREAIIVYGALSAVFDTCATKMRAFTTDDLLRKNFRGRPIEEWAQRATSGLDEWSTATLLKQFHRQIAQLSENRVERGVEASRARARTNRADYRAYLDWRVREGWYYGGLFACAIACGIDLRDIPQPWIDETLEAAVLAFDIHGSLRHACEEEIGHTLNYLPGDQHEKVSASLAAYTEILFRIQDADDLQPPAKEYLMRFITGLVVASYGCRRYNKTTALHIARPEDVAVAWSHIDDTPNYRFSYGQLETPAAALLPGRKLTMDPVDACPYLTLDAEAHRAPQALFEALRGQKSVHRDATTGFHLVADPDTVREVLQDSETYSSADAFSPALTEATRFLVSVLTEEQRRHFVSPVDSIMTSEGAVHKRLRKAVNAYFTANAMRRRHVAVRAHAASVMDTLAGDVDWVQDFCMPFTVRVIADLLGVPDTEYATITRWDNLLTSLATGADLSPETVYTYLDFTKEFGEYFHARASRLKQHPDNSILSHLIAQGDELTDHERIQFLLILFPAGSTTTVILLTHIALRLAGEPGLIGRLRDDADAIPDFIEDCIIESSPSANVFRTTTRQVVLQDTVIPAGSHLLLLIAAANQGTADRANHLAFGHGVHRCLGAQLARTEARAALEEFLTRYQRVSLTADVATLPIRPHLLIPAYPGVPVHLDPL